MTPKRLPLALLLLAPLTSGCLTLDLPDRYLELDSSRREVKAVSPDDSRLWVREFKDPDEGNAEFWNAALETELVQRRGYRLVERKTVTDAHQRSGTEFLFEVMERGIAYRYLLTLFVDEGAFSHTIRTAEYLAPLARFDEDLEEIRQAIHTLSL